MCVYVCGCVSIYLSIYIDNGILNITRNKIKSSVEMRINLETVMQSEVRQKNKYYILTHLCGI